MFGSLMPLYDDHKYIEEEWDTRESVNHLKVQYRQVNLINPKTSSPVNVAASEWTTLRTLQRLLSISRCLSLSLFALNSNTL